MQPFAALRLINAIIQAARFRIFNPHGMVRLAGLFCTGTLSVIIQFVVQTFQGIEFYGKAAP